MPRPIRKRPHTVSIRQSNCLAELTCPCCHNRIDGVTELDIDATTDTSTQVSKPYKGASSICCYCHVLLRFDAKEDGVLFLRRMTDDEYAALPAETQWMLDAVRKSVPYGARDGRTRGSAARPLAALRPAHLVPGPDLES